MAQVRIAGRKLRCLVTAYHEAGYTVVALHHGYEVTEAFVSQDRLGMDPANGTGVPLSAGTG
ncbi:MAG: hypothetical protein ACYDHY_17650 [Acidiferrobacterales bacterium]